MNTNACQQGKTGYNGRVLNGISVQKNNMESGLYINLLTIPTPQMSAHGLAKIYFPGINVHFSYTPIGEVSSRTTFTKLFADTANKYFL